MRCSSAQGFDKLLCLEEIAVEHYQHQIDAALRALHQMRGRALLADEVGLGKTIEAGIVMKELIQRGLVRTVLVLTPASLTEQWREELPDQVPRVVHRDGDAAAVAGRPRGRRRPLDREPRSRQARLTTAKPFSAANTTC